MMQNLQTDDIKQVLQIHPIHTLFSFPIEPFLSVQTFQRGDMIIHEGDTPDYLYYVLEGRAKIFTTQPNGKVALLNFITTGAFIGELELLQDATYSKGVQALTDLQCFAISIQQVKSLLLQDAHFLRLLCAYLSRKATMHSSRFAQGLSFPLENRLAEFILISSHEGIYKEKHTEVCEYLGVSYRHLLHVFAHFIKQKKLSKQGRTYIIEDATALQKMATVTHHLDVSLLDLVD